jgi:hypothetical protein
MTHLQRTALSIGALALSAGALTLLTPRAAHAVAAALVQVTNTVSNPAIVQGTDKQAAQQVDVACAVASPGVPNNCTSETPEAGFTANYVVPANETLVVTAVDMQPYTNLAPSTCSAGTGISLLVTGNVVRKSWYVFGTGTVHYAYPSGFLVGPGEALSLLVNPASACPAALELFGYLTSN